MTSYCLNLDLVLDIWADVVLQSMITLIANFLSIKFLLTCFFDFSTKSYLCFYDLNDILLYFFSNVDDLILLLCAFDLITAFHDYLILFLSHFFHAFFCLCKIYLYSVLPRSLRIFYFFLHLIKFFEKLSTETYSSGLIYESIKALEIRTSIVSNLVFPNNTILSCSFFRFSI